MSRTCVLQCQLSIAAMILACFAALSRSERFGQLKVTF